MSAEVVGIAGTNTASSTASRRPYRTGSVYRRSDGRWIGSLELARFPSDPRRRKTFVRYSREDAEAAIDAYIVEEARRITVRDRDRANDRLTARKRQRRVADFIRRALADARANGWGDEMLAQVIAASVSPSRVRFGVYGPCAYCGDPTASTVDHVLPRSRGGTHDAANLVSACYSCNSRKRTRTPEEWRASA